MIDSKVFDELMNKDIVTQVGLNPENYNDIDDLKNRGLATTIGATEEYNKLVNSISNENSEEVAIVVDDNKE